MLKALKVQVGIEASCDNMLGHTVLYWLYIAVYRIMHAAGSGNVSSARH